MEARDRKLKDWYGKIQRGEIKLPRFQRFEAWDWRRISSLFQTIIQNLPLGITLVLEIAEKEPFISRYIETAPKTNGRVLEHLLDGQQRLTALWRVLHNNYELNTYFVYIHEFDEIDYQETSEPFIFYKGRYFKKNGLRYPLWCDKPAEALKRGMIPTNLLKPEDISSEIEEWINRATEYKKPKEDIKEFEKFFDWKQKISDKIKELRSIVENYNLPFLSLPSNTPKDIALEVFINMNTNSKPLSQYDIIVAEVECVKGQSLHDMVAELNNKYPDVQKYDDITRLILNTSALLQDKLPNQRGAWDMDKEEMIANWKKMINGLSKMANFLQKEGVFDKQRLPTNAVLAVIGALYSFIPESGDKRGVDELLLKKYLWSSFFTDRYVNSAASRAYNDYLALKGVITNGIKKDGTPYSENDIPVFNRETYPLSDVEELLNAPWPKKETIRGKAILAVTCKLGALDFADGLKIDSNNIKNRHYHHIYPAALLKEANIESYLALNCALITDKTNLDIGRKDPLKYLTERYEWVNENIVNERLHSHLIPEKELSNGGYPDILNDEEKKEKIKTDFENFIKKRAMLFEVAAKKLTEGKNINHTSIFNEIQ